MSGQPTTTTTTAAELSPRTRTLIDYIEESRRRAKRARPARAESIGNDESDGDSDDGDDESYYIRLAATTVCVGHWFVRLGDAVPSAERVLAVLPDGRVVLERGAMLVSQTSTRLWSLTIDWAFGADGALHRTEATGASTYAYLGSSPGPIQRYTPQSKSARKRLQRVRARVVAAYTKDVVADSNVTHLALARVFSGDFFTRIGDETLQLFKATAIDRANCEVFLEDGAELVACNDFGTLVWELEDGSGAYYVYVGACCEAPHRRYAPLSDEAMDAIEDAQLAVSDAKWNAQRAEIAYRAAVAEIEHRLALRRLAERGLIDSQSALEDAERRLSMLRENAFSDARQSMTKRKATAGGDDDDDSASASEGLDGRHARARKN